MFTDVVDYSIVAEGVYHNPSSTSQATHLASNLASNLFESLDVQKLKR